MAFGGKQRGPARLEDGATRATVAAECRAAALELMAGAARGWGKIDLAGWLTGPYRRATRHCQHGERTLVADGMRLLDRVRTLFVADYLDDPVAYRTLYVCHRCEAVVFDESARRIGMCSAHRRTSGILFRDDEERGRAAGDP